MVTDGCPFGVTSIISDTPAQKSLGKCRWVPLSLIGTGHEGSAETKDNDVRRYRSLSATLRGQADRAMCAALVTSVELKVAKRPVSAFGIESTNAHQWLPSAHLEPPIT